VKLSIGGGRFYKEIHYVFVAFKNKEKMFKVEKLVSDPNIFVFLNRFYLLSKNMTIGSDTSFSTLNIFSLFLNATNT
jgi:hypothetical protein